MGYERRMFQLKKIDRKKYILPSVLVILLCVICFVGTAWAWYSGHATAKVEEINAATYGVQVEVMTAADDSVVAKTSKTSTKQVLRFDSNNEYKVKLQATGVATTGYCGENTPGFPKIIYWNDRYVISKNFDGNNSEIVEYVIINLDSINPNFGEMNDIHRFRDEKEYYAYMKQIKLSEAEAESDSANKHRKKILRIVIRI